LNDLQNQIKLSVIKTGKPEMLDALNSVSPSTPVSSLSPFLLPSSRPPLPLTETLVTVFLIVASLATFITLDVTRHLPHDEYSMFKFMVSLVAILSPPLSPILTHVYTSQRMFGNKYKYWQPFKGGTPFVLFQATGW
jgi:hypothetical protein